MSVIDGEMAVEASPTEKRIDDLSGRFEDRFERFEDKVEARFDKLDARLDNWGKMIGGGVVTIVVSIVSAVVLKFFGA